MLKGVRWSLTWVAMIGAAGLALACGGDGGDVVGADPAQIRVTVQTDGAAAGGITVRLFASGGTTPLSQATTGSNGQATFSNLDAGTFDVEVVVPSNLALDEGETARRAVTASAGSTATVTFSLVTPLPPNTEEVVLSGVTFSPSALTISRGTTVRWRNAQAVGHTVTPDGHNEWNRATLTNAGQTFSHTFNTVGTFPYYCEPHRSQGMTGTITVQ